MSAPAPDRPARIAGRRTPVLVVTGFLGAGKTTLINTLAAGAGLRLALIVNEFGATGVDGRLLQGAGRLVEIANGCICCVTNGDLRAALGQVLAEGGDLDGIVIETSGLADPAPVVALFEEAGASAPTSLVGVVTLVDALNFDDNLERAEVALRQIVVADLLAITKADLVAADVPDKIAAGLRRLNPDAAIVFAGDLGGLYLAELLPRPARRPAAALAHADHGHDAAFESVTLTAPAPLDPHRLDAWLDGLPDTVVRAKGFIRLRGRPDLMVMQLVGRRRSAQPAAAPDPAVGGAELVVIGAGLDRPALERGLNACVAG
jgi:G3E family GTPase